MTRDELLLPWPTQEKYRYTLTRKLVDETEGRPRLWVAFVMLNPSTADENRDDPTIRRCKAFAMQLGATNLGVVNLFAYRATDPRRLEYDARNGVDVIGERNDTHIRIACEHASVVIAAWGARGGFLGRDRAVMKIIDQYNPVCFGATKDGHPRHPLYVRADAPLVPFKCTP